MRAAKGVVPNEEKRAAFEEKIQARLGAAYTGPKGPIACEPSAARAARLRILKRVWKAMEEQQSSSVEGVTSSSCVPGDEAMGTTASELRTAEPSQRSTIAAHGTRRASAQFDFVAALNEMRALRPCTSPLRPASCGG